MPGTKGHIFCDSAYIEMSRIGESTEVESRLLVGCHRLGLRMGNDCLMSIEHVELDKGDVNTLRCNCIK